MSSGVSTATAATMSRLTNDIYGIRSHPKSCDVHAVAGSRGPVTVVTGDFFALHVTANKSRSCAV